MENLVGVPADVHVTVRRPLNTTHASLRQDPLGSHGNNLTPMASKTAFAITAPTHTMAGSLRPEGEGVFDEHRLDCRVQENRVSGVR
jgi:hypothetical protein